MVTRFFFFEEEEEGERVNDPKWKNVIEFDNSNIELSLQNDSNSDPPVEKPESDSQSRVYVSASEKSQLDSTNFEISQIDCSESGGGVVFTASDQLLMLDSFQETYRYNSSSRDSPSIWFTTVPFKTLSDE